MLCHPHAWAVLSLSTDLRAHKAHLGLALDGAARLLKYPLPDDAEPRRRLAGRLQELVREHDRLRGCAERLLARETLAPNAAALVSTHLEPAAREWMLYFVEALQGGRPLPMLFGLEQASLPPCDSGQTAGPPSSSRENA